MNNQTLQDWTIARIVAEYDFPQNAAEAIVAQEMQWQIVGWWREQIRAVPTEEKDQAWIYITQRIDLMSRTDMSEDKRRQVFGYGLGILSDTKDANGYRVLIVRAFSMSDLDGYADAVRAKDRQVVVRRLRKNVFRIFTLPLFREAQ